ncbi:dihydrolipoamide acetyltransferase family protein [Sphingomonas profundi]|uniref:dihydrolipoamide acetyltransferase family protein n=1 Tax=Alterirhizorhabdus profundi TaxID=2681549 RepID=UPI0012E889D2|nr:dihydrolipoamide acetyltransferase family protein [Sphingomonas profundi]
MTTDLLMPAFSPTMEYGTIAKWLVREGDPIAPGDLLAEVETDKATMELEAEEGGVLLSILVPQGTDDVAVGTAIARIGVAESESAGQATPHREPAPTPTGEAVMATAIPAVPAAPPTAGALARVRRDPPVYDGSSSALARKVAEARGMDLHQVKGSGAGGRILLADILPVRAMVSATSSAPAPVPAAVPAAAPPQEPPTDIPFHTLPLSAMRRTIARRLTESKRDVPHFYLSSDCRIDALLALRAQLNAGLAASGVKISINDFLMKALAVALVMVPEANVRFGGDTLYMFDRVDIAMAVAVEGGLVTPVINDVGRCALSALSQQSRALADAARDGSLAPEVCRGGTVSLSNLGMYGVSEMIPIINPPQAMILGVGASEARFVPDGAGAPQLATILRATASFDHRAIDGAIAARVMQAFREAVEQPLAIVA